MSISKVKISEDLLFTNKKDSTDYFKLIQFKYYPDNKSIWCAYSNDGGIYPLHTIYLNDYYIIVNNNVIQDYELIN